MSAPRDYDDEVEEIDPFDTENNAHDWRVEREMDEWAE